MNYAVDRLDRRARVLAPPDQQDEYQVQGQRQAVVGIADARRSNSSINSSSTHEDLLTKDYSDGLRNQNHELLGRTLRDMGWNAQAVYHYGQQWCQRPNCASSAGDYAQMAELAGFPEIGLLALLSFRAKLSLKEPHPIMTSNETDEQNPKDDETWAALGAAESTVLFSLNESTAFNHNNNNQYRRRSGWHCGCQAAGCGAMSCFVPMVDLGPVYSAMDTFLAESVRHRQVSAAISANQLWNILLKGGKNPKQSPTCEDDFENNQNSDLLWIPEIVRFWEKEKDDNDGEEKEIVATQPQIDPERDLSPSCLGSTTSTTMAKVTTTIARPDGGCRALPFVVQLLLVKLAYVTFPLLALESLAHMPLDGSCFNELAKSHKSHHAYYVLVRAVALGKRVKPHRPKLHVPVWDRVMLIPTHHQPQNAITKTTTATSTSQSSFLIPSSNPSLLFQQSVSAASEALRTERDTATQRDTSTTSFSPLWYHRQWSSLMLVVGEPEQQQKEYVEVRPLFLVGDSHVLSLAWQPISIPGCHRVRVAVPIVITGMKARHVHHDTRFFSHTNLRTMVLDRLLAQPDAPCKHPSSNDSNSDCPEQQDQHQHPKATRTIVMSAGEIDCREGLGGPLLEGYTNNSVEAMMEPVCRTVQEYVTGLQLLADQANLQILVMPVAPHAQQATGRVVGQAFRRKTMRLWNEELRRQLTFSSSPSSRGATKDHPSSKDKEDRRVFLLDYEQDLIVAATLKTRAAKDDHYNPNETTTETTTTASATMAGEKEDGYVLRPEFDADGTHMNSAFLPHFAHAIANCGCNLDAL